LVRDIKSTFLIDVNCTFVDSTVENITKYLPAYQKLIQNLKEEGYTVIGYVRKSPTAKDDTN
jgi:phosphoserine phosphatase